MGMRRTTAPLPVDHQHRHSQPTSAPKATISTINVSAPAGAAAEAGAGEWFPRRADRDRLRPIKAPSSATWRRAQMAAYSALFAMPGRIR